MTGIDGTCEISIHLLSDMMDYLEELRRDWEWQGGGAGNDYQYQTLLETIEKARESLLKGGVR